MFEEVNEDAAHSFGGQVEIDGLSIADGAAHDELNEFC